VELLAGRIREREKVDRDEGSLRGASCQLALPNPLVGRLRRRIRKLAACVAESAG